VHRCTLTIHFLAKMHSFKNSYLRQFATYLVKTLELYHYKYEQFDYEFVIFKRYIVWIYIKRDKGVLQKNCTTSCYEFYLLRHSYLKCHMVQKQSHWRGHECKQPLKQ